MKITAIVAAAGSGVRLKKKKPKALVYVGGKPLFLHTLENLTKAGSFSEIILLVPPGHLKAFATVLKKHRWTQVKIALGGKTRAASVYNGLQCVAHDCSWVLIHDAARPLVTKAILKRLTDRIKKKNCTAVLCGVPVNATVKRVNLKSSEIIGTENRESLFIAQTPQVFKKEVLLRRYSALGSKAFQATDEAALFDGTTVKVFFVLGDNRNIKVTTPEDMELFKGYQRCA